jgi:hypothetical protein
MRYFFDIHLDGQCHLDDHGEEFNSAKEARQYVVDCGRTCAIDGLPHERRTMAQCIIEITDRGSLSDLVTMADVIPTPRERAIKRRKPWRESVYPRSFVWHAHRVGPGWVASRCGALAWGVMVYYVAGPSHLVLDKIQLSPQATEAAQTLPATDEYKPAVVTMREEPSAPVTPVVLNPGAGDSGENDQPKDTDSAGTRSRAIGAQSVRRSVDDGPNAMRPSRQQPTAYRSYKDLRNFTLNR